MTKTTVELYRRHARRTVTRKNATLPEVVEIFKPATAAVVSNTKTSDKVPGYRKRIRLHQNAVSSRTIDSSKWSGGNGSAGVEFKHRITLNGVVQVVPAYEIWYGTIFYATTYPSLPGSSVNADNQARMRFYKRAKSAQTAFRGLTALGELRETLGMLRNPGKALRRGLDDYIENVKKRTRRAKRSSFNRIVGETWLEHAFGWAPFISDIKSAGEALNRRLDRFAGSYTRVSGTGLEETDSFDAAYTTDDDSWLSVAYRRLVRTIVSVRYYGEVRSVCENPRQADMQLFGTNFREIIPTAWELIPYSFLADYFGNIGEILDAWSFRKSDIAWSGRVVRYKAIRTLSESFVRKAYTENAVNQFISWQARYLDVSHYRVVRTRIERDASLVPLPQLQLKMPGFGTKWINMSALLVSRNRTRKQLFR